MKLPPIPASLRQETIELRNQTDDGFDEAVSIAHCRVDRAAALSPNEYQVTEGCTARVLIDATEFDGVVYEGDLVGFDAEWHAVSTVNRIDHPDGSVHHWELDCR